MKTKIFKTRIIFETALLLLILIVGLAKSTAYISDQSDFSVRPVQESTYLIQPYNSTHYGARNFTGYSPSLTGYEFLSTNASYIEESVWNSMTNGIIQYQEGTYNFPTPITHSGTSKNVKIIGSGIYATKFNYTGSTNTGSFWTIGDVESFIMSELTLEANNNTDTIFNSTGISNPNSNSYKAMQIYNCHFNNSGASYGVSFFRTGSQNYLIEFHHNRIEQSGAMTGTASATGGGMEIAVGDGDYHDNIISNNGGSTDILLLTSGTNRIHDNYIGGTSNYGIYVWTSFNTIVNNIIDHYNMNGIYVRAVVGNIIANNKVSNVGLIADNTYSAIYITNAIATNNSLTGNVFYQATGNNRTSYCIKENNPAFANNINNNFFAGFATAAYLVNASTHVGLGNIISGLPMMMEGSSSIASGSNSVSVTLTPNLAGTPIAIILTSSNSTVGARDLIPSNLAATGFIVTQVSDSGAGTFYYIAIFR